ncbi:S8 family serine peptidase [Nostoc sp.]|uniref:S8 family serine peptidase n=1 Tax=Nostoc sp. TaxID=1180 RepID=UPI002FFC59B1
MIVEDDFDFTDEELESASHQIRELWGAEVDDSLENLLEYQMLAEEGGVKSSKRYPVIVHYKLKKSFDDFLDEFDKFEDFYQKRQEKFEFNQFDEYESYGNEYIDSLLKDLPDKETGEHLRLGNAVVAQLTSQELKKVAGRDDVEYVEFDKPARLELDQSSNTIGLVNARTEGLVGTGKGIIIAVIDGEVDINHPDLKGRVVHKRNYTDEPWGTPIAPETDPIRNSYVHGTHVAGIIAGNGSKYKGMAPKAIIWSYKIFPTNGESSESRGADAIEDVINDMKEGVRIANCSWGVTSAKLDGKSIVAKTVERATKLGLILVKSAGNDGLKKPGSGSITSPADAKGDVIVVGASSHDGTRVMNFSSRGPTDDNRPKPDILAPGEKIMSAKPGGGYQPLNGTSMATPHIAGIAALMLERNPKLKPWQIKRILMQSARKLDSPEYDENTQGMGLVDVVKAFELVEQPIADQEKITYSSTVKERKLFEQLNICVRNTGEETMQAVKASLVTNGNGNGIKITKAEQDLGNLRIGAERMSDFEIEVPPSRNSGQHEFTLNVNFITPTGEQKTQSYKIPYKVPSLQR